MEGIEELEAQTGSAYDARTAVEEVKTVLLFNSLSLGGFSELKSSVLFSD